MKPSPAKAAPLLLAAARAVGLSLLLELGTVWGTPQASVLDAALWSKRRLVVFWLLALGLQGIVWLMRRRGVRLPRASRAAAVRALMLTGAYGACVLALLLGSWLVLGAPDHRLAFLVGGLAFSVALCVRRRELLRQRLEYAYLAIAVPVGIGLCVAMPVVAEVSWDGQIHFNSATALSYVYGARYTKADLIMSSADAVLHLDLLATGSIDSVWNPKQDLESFEFANALLEGQDLDPEVLEPGGTEVSGGGSYLAFTSVGYLPSAVGLWLGRLLHLGIGRYLLARLTSMLCYCLAFFVAIRCLRRGKVLLLTLGLIPTPLLMACNFSYDPWCFALVTLSFALYVSRLQRAQGGEPITLSQLVPTLACFVLGALVKAIVFPLLLVFFVTPTRLFATRRDALLARASCVVLVLLLLASFALPFVVTRPAGDARGGAGIDSMGQVAYVLANPASYAATVVRFSASFFAPAVVLGEGGTFGSFLYLVPPSLGQALSSVLAIALMALAAVGDARLGRGGMTVGSRAAAAVGIVCSYLLIVTALYVSFTPVGADYVAGVQQRYLLPLLAALLLVLLDVPRASGRPRPGREGVVPPLVVAGELLLYALVVWVFFLARF